MPRNEQCEECGLCSSSKYVCVWGTGEGDAFIVGEAPGREEARTGKSFVGQSGQLLRSLLERVGLSEAYITNTVKCQPPGNRKPEPDEIRACRIYLDEEIEERDPRAILLLGATAMRSQIGKTKITEMNGQVVEKNGRTYVCAFHPAYCLRDPSKEPHLLMALRRYKEVLEGEFNDDMPAYRVVDSSSLEDFLRAYRDCSRFSFDLETTGLEWWVCDINCMQMSMDSGPNTESTTWVIPNRIGSVMPEEQFIDLVRYLVSHQGKRKAVGQNAKFDNLFLKRVCSATFRLDFDTNLASHLTDENAEHGLKTLARIHLGAPDYDLSLKEKKGGGSKQKLFDYGAADAFYTLGLVDPLSAKMDEDDSWLFENLIIPAARAFVEIEYNGLYVDLDRRDEVEASEIKARAQAIADLNKVVGREVNWNSPKQVADVLYNQLKLTPTVFTDKGHPSTGEEALIDLNHPIKDLIESYRKHEKFLSTYIDGWKPFMVGPHLYLGFKLSGTVTGRYSGRLHQVPRDGVIRNIITAPPGWTFVQMDLSQAELRIIAIVSQDPEMLKVFGEGKVDIHWQTLMDVIETGQGKYVTELLETAQKVRGKRMSFARAMDVVRELGPKKAEELWKGWKEGRKEAKGINFGFPYGQSAEGFTSYAKNTYGFEPTIEEAHQFRNTFFNRYNRLHDWHDRQKKLVRSQGYVTNLIGRKRRLPGIYSKDRSVVAECERQSINAPVQGYIGDHKAAILVEIHETLPRDKLRVVGEVHDSILMWVKNEYRDEVLKEVHHIANHPQIIKKAGLNLPIPLTVDIELGRWGAGKPWNP